MVAGPARVVAFCADDVGLVAGVAATVAELACEGRLSAASCVTTQAAWASEGAIVIATTARLTGFELGLHLNLTEGAPLTPDLGRVWPLLPALERLILLSHLGRLPRAELAIELRAQLDAFAAVTAQRPAYVDGHQHVHHLPGVRDIMLGAVEAMPGERPALRNTGHVVGPGHAFKRMLIERTGGRALQGLLQARRIRHNSALLGVYDFRADDYRRLMQGWLAAAPTTGGLVYCHPNRRARLADDSIGDARQREADYLSSAEFAADLAAAGVSVGPAWQSSSAG